MFAVHEIHQSRKFVNHAEFENLKSMVSLAKGEISQTIATHKAIRASEFSGPFVVGKPELPPITPAPPPADNSPSVGSGHGIPAEF